MKHNALSNYEIKRCFQHFDFICAKLHVLFSSKSISKTYTLEYLWIYPR